ncbi:olfactory receptor 52R1-like [Mauremys reevesii]|uniref:olfactory receptor 52R1-like n=1 Tax=Mauremys reevesii TaxID=260615 RepID=UPI00193F7786|nr:olfactory receptor 52R1-like [Mauremys reevesii]
MSDSNKTDFTNPSTFILLGIPGMEMAHVWISIPFSAMYAIITLGNFTILFIIKMELSLHGPMYYFLCMLAGSDLVVSTSIVPKMLSIFWFNSREIDFSACLTQMYFIHCASAMESGICVAMALDHYVAICHPLRHSTILTNPMVAKIGLAVVLCSGLLALPLPFLIRQWPYCRTIIPEPFCLHVAMVKLACANTSVSSYYGLFVLFCVMGLDVILIAVSYIQILRAIFSLPTKDVRLKTLGTCSSHLCVILAFYIPGLFSSLMYWFGQNVAVHFHVFIANMFLLLPPMLHPIIYGVMTRQIWDSLLRLFTHKGKQVAELQEVSRLRSIHANEEFLESIDVEMSKAGEAIQLQRTAGTSLGEEDMALSEGELWQLVTSGSKQCCTPTPNPSTVVMENRYAALATRNEESPPKVREEKPCTPKAGRSSATISQEET